MSGPTPGDHVAEPTLILCPDCGGFGVVFCWDSWNRVRAIDYLCGRCGQTGRVLAPAPKDKGAQRV